MRRGGRVTEAAVHREVLDKVRRAGDDLGLETMGQRTSPLAGRKSGNVEFLVWWRDARRPAAPAAPAPLS